ncbi:MAG: hypothetical protein LBK77_07425 [Spirochaetaceae bacterium]|jgi:NADH:ubiquinone oxidoreductase subunit 3 (subunit A)|nr:hypothetical protein [Spirochaetaceae bacterium]
MTKNNLKIIVIVAVVIVIAVGGFLGYQILSPKTSDNGGDAAEASVNGGGNTDDGQWLNLAIKEIEGYFREGTKPDDFNSENNEEITKIRNAGIERLQKSGSNQIEIDKIKQSIKDNIDAIKTKEEILTEKKNAAIDELKNFDSDAENNFTPEQKAERDRIRNEYENKINDYTDPESIDAELEKAKAEILDKKKTAAIDKLKNFGLDSENNFTPKQKKEWERIKKEYESKINNCADPESIDTELENAKTAIKEIPTAFERIDRNFEKIEEIGKQIGEINAKLETEKDALSFWDKYLVVFIWLLLALVYIVTIVTIILVLRLYKQKKREFEEYKNDINKQFDRFAETSAKSRDEYSQIKRKIDTVSEKTWNLEDKLNEKEHYTPSFFSGPKTVPEPSNTAVELPPLAEFNLWAKDPYAKSLPRSFYYVKETPKIREEQEFTETSFEAKWICNRRGEEKYILPNPRLFDLLTDISNFYKMDANRLQAKGQNKINVTVPCRMTDKGWITYPGELEIL